MSRLQEKKNSKLSFESEEKDQLVETRQPTVEFGQDHSKNFKQQVQDQSVNMDSLFKAEFDEFSVVKPQEFKVDFDNENATKSKQIGQQQPSIDQSKGDSIRRGCLSTFRGEDNDFTPTVTPRGHRKAPPNQADSQQKRLDTLTVDIKVTGDQFQGLNYQSLEPKFQFDHQLNQKQYFLDLKKEINKRSQTPVNHKFQRQYVNRMKNIKSKNDRHYQDDYQYQQANKVVSLPQGVKSLPPGRVLSQGSPRKRQVAILNQQLSPRTQHQHFIGTLRNSKSPDLVQFIEEQLQFQNQSLGNMSPKSRRTAKALMMSGTQNKDILELANINTSKKNTDIIQSSIKQLLETNTQIQIQITNLLKEGLPIQTIIGGLQLGKEQAEAVRRLMRTPTPQGIYGEDELGQTTVNTSELQPLSTQQQSIESAKNGGVLARRNIKTILKVGPGNQTEHTPLKEVSRYGSPVGSPESHHKEIELKHLYSDNLQSPIVEKLQVLTNQLSEMEKKVTSKNFPQRWHKQKTGTLIGSIVDPVLSTKDNKWIASTKHQSRPIVQQPPINQFTLEEDEIQQSPSPMRKIQLNIKREQESFVGTTTSGQNRRGTDSEFRQSFKELVIANNSSGTISGTIRGDGLNSWKAKSKESMNVIFSKKSNEDIASCLEPPFSISAQKQKEGKRQLAILQRKQRETPLTPYSQQRPFRGMSPDQA